MSVSEAGDLKHRLAGWKELIVLVDSVLAWEKVSSVIFLYIKEKLNKIMEYS